MHPPQHMSTPLRALILEDHPDDAKLMIRELRRAGLAPNWERVETESDYLAHLDPALDVILADYNLPQFDALRALHLLQERGLDIPFIIVSGAIGEDLAVAAMKEGAADYLLKDRLTRLGQAVSHALQERQLHIQKRQAEAALRESEERYRRLVELSPDLVAVHSTGKLVFINTAGAQLLGASSPEQLLGRSILDFVHTDVRGIIQRLVEQVEAGVTVSPIEEQLIRLDGTAVAVEVAASPFTYLNSPAVQIVAHDITERKRAEIERAQLLARERAARAQAEAVSRIKDEFLATLSHELRTPLNAILGWASMLRSGNLDEATATLGLEAVERNAKEQAQLIGDLLDVSRIISGNLRLDIQPVELRSAIEAALSTARPAAEAKGIQLQSVMDPAAGPVSGDPHRLQQVIWNLLSNAIKFTPTGGRVEVRLARAGPRIKITVSDTGEGISAEFLPFIFERFRQADSSTTRAHGGLGLGLAIVRHLVELHGGSIHAASQGKGRGASFTVSLPFKADRPDETTDETQMGFTLPPTGGAAPENLPRLDGLRVLVVDDDADTCELLTIMLTQCGAEVSALNSVPRALEALAEWRPDLLVADIGMPVEDGYTLIRQVRALVPERGGQIPAVALTAYASTEDRQRALAAGYQIHLPKPVEPAELATVVVSLSPKMPQRKQWTKNCAS